MVGYVISNMFFDYGMVNRGVVIMDDQYMFMEVNERYKIWRVEGVIYYFGEDD